MRENSYHEQRKEFIYKTAHSAIDSGYSSALSHYRALKDDFLKQLNLTKQVSADEFLQQCMQAAEEEATSGIQAQQLQEQLSDLKNAILEYMKHAGRLSEFQAVKQKWEKDKAKGFKMNKENILNRMKKTLNTFLESKTINQKILQIVGNNQTEKSMGYYYGFLRQVIIESFNAQVLQVNFQRYITGLAAEYKEEMETNAFLKVLEQYGYKAIQTAQLTNEKGQEIIYDIMLFSNQSKINVKDKNILQEYISKLDALSGTVIGTGKIQEFGVQSKSWYFPKEEINLSPGVIWTMKFGNYTAGLPDDEELHWWHAGVRNAMNNILEILGAGNVIYTLGGNQMMWTYDMLLQMHKMNIVLGYYWEKGTEKITSGEVHGFVHSCS